MLVIARHATLGRVFVLRQAWVSPFQPSYANRILGDGVKLTQNAHRALWTTSCGRHRDPGGAHGDDERLRESSLYKEVEFLWKSVVRVAAS